MSTNQYLTALSENATRLGMRLQESISEHTRDLQQFTRVGGLGLGAGSAYLDGEARAANDSGNGNWNAMIKKQLESSSDREKLDAMRRLIAMISKNNNSASTYFPSVVKLVASPSLEIRKLVYIYLLHYSPFHPDLALLSINTFQRDLSDPSPLIRAMALRVLSGMGVSMLAGVVLLGTKKCAADLSPYVRKVAGLAIVKCYDLEPSNRPALLQIIQTLLSDRSPLALGAALHAFSSICLSPVTTFDSSTSQTSQSLEMIHSHFRRYCKILVEMDEWGQVVMMRVLGRYARVMLPRPVWHDRDGEEAEEVEIDKDLKLLLDSVKPVLQSQNPAVVTAATRILYHLGPPSHWPSFVPPLLRLLTTSKEVERVVLTEILSITRRHAYLFAPYYTRFLLFSDELIQIKEMRIKVLLELLNTENYAAILRELIDYADDTSDKIVATAISGIGTCAIKISECRPQCLNALIGMIRSRYDAVVTNAIMVLRRLVQFQLSSQASLPPSSSSTHSPLSIIAHLARRIDEIHHPKARACVVWLVGQYAGVGVGSEGSQVAEWAPDVLRKLAKSFGTEASVVKVQVVTLAAKLVVLSRTDAVGTGGLREKVEKLGKYVFSLARYDKDWDVRDRGRMLAALVFGQEEGEKEPESWDEVESRRQNGKGSVVLRREQVLVVLFEGKGTGSGDAEGTVGRGGIGEEKEKEMKNWTWEDDFPEWMERGVESSLRDSELDSVAVNVGVVPSGFGSGPVGGRSVPGTGLAVASVPIVLTPTTTTTTTDGGTSTPQGTTGKGAYMDLDAFYADAEEEDEEESDSVSEPESESESGAEEEESLEEEEDEDDGDAEEEESRPTAGESNGG